VKSADALDALASYPRRTRALAAASRSPFATMFARAFARAPDANMTFATHPTRFRARARRSCMTLCSRPAARDLAPPSRDAGASTTFMNARALAPKKSAMETKSKTISSPSTTSNARASQGANASSANVGGAVAVAFAVAVAARALKRVFDAPSRAYVPGANTVGVEYDAWTSEGILEHYWGEHIHLGWYDDDALRRGAGTLLGNKVVDFIQAKFDFVDKMRIWSEAVSPKKVLDVGCGIGGTSRHLAKTYGVGTEVTGITLSANQAKRATELAKEQGVTNAKFEVMNALEMKFEDNTFDLVWACESGEHMPDKKKYVEEMVRVLKPGGKIVIATWCQRERPPEFTKTEEENLRFLYEEWAHPYFISFEEYERLLRGTGAMASASSENWVKNTIASWRHSIWVGVYDPWPVVFAGPRVWYKTVREIVTLERMHRAFARGLMTYGMIKGTKALENAR